MHSSEVFFHPSGSSETFILLQLTPELLDKDLVIKASSKSSSVLCTGGATFQLKDVQQSNSLIFLAPASNDRHEADLSIAGEAASWLETIRIHRPPIRLGHVPAYDGDRQGVKGVTREALLASIPASAAEIQAVMDDELCIPLSALGDNIVRLEMTYTLECLHLIINTLQSLGHDLGNLSREALPTVDFNEDGETKFADRQVLHAVLRRFTTTVQEEKLRMDGDEIATFSGLCVLRDLATSEAIARTTLMTAWREATPVPFRDRCVLETRLRGHYVEPSATQVVYLSPTSLSPDAKTRMAELFRVRDRWPEAELLPWLESLPACIDATTGQVMQKAVQGVLLKFARRTKVGKTVFIEPR